MELLQVNQAHYNWREYS